MSHELPLPPWVPEDYTTQTWLQKDILVRYTTALPPNAILDPDYVRVVTYLAPASVLIPPGGSQ